MVAKIRPEMELLARVQTVLVEKTVSKMVVTEVPEPQVAGSLVCGGPRVVPLAAVRVPHWMTRVNTSLEMPRKQAKLVFVSGTAIAHCSRRYLGRHGQ